MIETYWQSSKYGYYAVIHFPDGKKCLSPTTRLEIQSETAQEYLELTQQLNTFFKTNSDTALFPEDVEMLVRDKRRRVPSLR